MSYIQARGSSYLITVSQGQDQNGKRKRITKTWKPVEGMSKKEIKQGLNTCIAELEQTVMLGVNLKAGSMQFAEFAALWMENYAKVELKDRTLSSYESMLKKILPEIGHIRLNQLQPYHLNAFCKKVKEPVDENKVSYICTIDFRNYIAARKLSLLEFSKKAGIGAGTVYAIAQKKKVAAETAEKVCKTLGVPISAIFESKYRVKPLAQKTVYNYYSLISSMLETAVEWNYIMQNPTSRTKTPRYSKENAKSMDKQQTQYMLKMAADETPFVRLLAYLSVGTGMRRGEMLGLEWKDIDFDNKTMAILRNVVYTSKKGIITTTPKTADSVRTITLSAVLIRELKAYQAYQRRCKQIAYPDWRETDRILTNIRGETMHPDTVSKMFKQFMQRIHLEEFTLHSMRHTHASLLIAEGIDIRTVSSRVGHSRTSTTLDIYAHSFEAGDKNAAEKMNTILL